MMVTAARNTEAPEDTMNPFTTDQNADAGDYRDGDVPQPYWDNGMQGGQQDYRADYLTGGQAFDDR
jgi:hypothetical protein